ncbi:MAG TPA: fasciclin domain-containing protein [Prolixibacteraceae bacterium]|nr:fasciclin domain-containing protein [Prolixibacteraceae bacterium]
MSVSDYAFYFGREFETHEDIFYYNGRIVSDEMFAENGFVYSIDRVVEPIRNGAELLTDKSKPYSYSTYYNLINQFSELYYNEQATNKQAGADEGLKVDSLFNLAYPQLVIDINSEKTKPPKGTFGLPGNVTIRYHHGIVAPTNEAFNQLVSQYLSGTNNWGSVEDAPENIKRIIANSCLSINAIYPTDIQKGFMNGESDIIQIDESSIIQKEFGSNCTFIGVNKPIVPRAFSSVAGPVYLRKGFSKVMWAIESAGLLSALKRKDANYSFFVESDLLSSADSSFLYNPSTKQFSAVSLYPSVRTIPLTVTDLRILLLNHIGLDQPKGIARKEFIKNMAGNFLIFDNVSKEVKGTAPSTYGYQGSEETRVFPRKINSNSDNGSTYEIDNWLNFGASSIFSTISTKYPKFHALMKKAGLSDDKLFKYKFISDNKNYTVFMPNDSVLSVTNTDVMSVPELKNFLLMHFVQGDMIFTDGNKNSGYYETARVDQSSSPHATIYTKIRIETGIDKITIPSKEGLISVVVDESPTSNILTAVNINTAEPTAYPNVMNNGVIHEIQKVLLFKEVDTK